ncbi:hypothetical protein QPK13_04545 [Photorhabdus tasmaniensis]
MKIFSISILVLISALFGCASPTNPLPVKDDVKLQLPIEAIRHGQYTLVSISPTKAQQYPIQQIISYSIPPQLNVSIADAMQYALKDTGYSLCPPDDQANILFQQPLPAIHRFAGSGRLAFFTSDECSSCDAQLTSLLASGKPVDIYLVGSQNDDSRIRTWALKRGIDTHRVKNAEITLNHDTGRWLTLGKGKMPALIQKRGSEWVLVSP